MLYNQYFFNICAIFAQYLQYLQKKKRKYSYNIRIIYAQYLHNKLTIFSKEKLCKICTIFVEYLKKSKFMDFLHNLGHCFWRLPLSITLCHHFRKLRPIFVHCVDNICFHYMHKRPWMDFVINPAFCYTFSQEEQKKNNLHKKSTSMICPWKLTLCMKPFIRLTRWNIEVNDHKSKCLSAY